MNLLIRADGSSEIGTGHLVRCFALAEEWLAKGGSVRFASIDLPDQVKNSLAVTGIEWSFLDAAVGSTQDCSQTRQLAEAVDAAWIVLDGYHFHTDFQAQLKRGGRRVLMLDDFGHSPHYCADVVLNQNLYASEQLYPSRDPDTRLLLGTRYVLLRRQFERWRGWSRPTPARASSILVTLGGGDLGGRTSQVIDALAAGDLGPLEVVVVAGPSNPHLEAIRASARRAPFQAQVLSAVSDMATVMATADLSVSGGGTTCWELAFMGVPNLVIALAPHQRLIASAVAGAGAAVDVGTPEGPGFDFLVRALQQLIADPGRRDSISTTGRRLVDGLGSHRTVGELMGPERYAYADPLSGE